MNLYTDDNPQTTLKGLGFKNKLKAKYTIKKVENYFDNMLDNQIIPGWTPENVLPKKYIESYEDAYHYYQKQKMYRILGMNNRAKGMIKRIKDDKKIKSIKEAMKLFNSWLEEYKNYQLGSGNTPYCCSEQNNTSNYCYRKSDMKKFKLPRKYTLDKCKQGIRGFSMRSSCAPYKDCINN